MGQQQLLLIVLGVIIVGIAIVVGINLFNANSISSNRDAIVSDLNNLAAMAHEYYSKPTAMGGGSSSYVNFTMPTGLSSNANGAYTILTPGAGTGATSTITFQGVGTQIVTGSNYVTEVILVKVPPLADSCAPVNGH
jgi:Tfp pilus assembly protein PilE